jgi:nitrogen fixation negative regulator NifL
MNAENAKPLSELEERLRFETLIADLSSKFVNLPAGEVDQEITVAQRRICEELGLDFATLWQGAEDGGGGFVLTHFYSVIEGAQPAVRMTEDQYPWARAQLLAGRVLAIAALEELPAEAARDRETLREFGIKSNLALPLAVGGKPPVGIFGLGTLRAERPWPEALVTRLQLLAQVFTHTLERKRADQALRESQKRLSLAADSAEAGLWELDCDTQVFWVTEKARILFSFTPEETISVERIKASVLPDDWEFVQRSLDHSLQTGEPLHVEYRIRLGDGRERWIASRGRPYFKSNGEPKRLLGLSTDITERKRVEAQLHQLSLAVEQSPALVVITDLQGRISYVNRKFSEVTGYALEECLGRNPRILKSGECPPTTYAELWTTITSGRAWRGEFHNRKKNGELYWEWAVISPLLNAAGKVTNFVGVKEDITERKRNEAALRASEARLAAGTELAGLGYYEVDYAERTSLVDDRFREICGIPAALVQSFQAVEFWLQHVHADDHQLISQERQKLHAGQLDRIALEYRYAHPTLGQRWLHHSARVASRRADGGGIRTFGVIRDITHQKQTELDARDLRSNLAHAERVNLLGQLASALAHELSQPLGAILRNAEAAEIMLQEPSPDLEELRAIITDILRDDQRAGQVIDRLRSLLKRRSLDLQPMELPSVIAEVLSLVRVDAAARHLRLDYVAGPGLPRIRGDRIHLQQVLLNLFINAMDAMEECPSGQRCIQVSVQLTGPATVAVRVCDNGPGVSAESLEKLFDPFFTTKANGMGMGLAVSKTIVAAHQGRLWAENRPEGGACFCFTLPVASGESQGAGASDK